MRQVEEKCAGGMGELTMVESVLKETVFRYSKEQLKDTHSPKEDKAQMHKTIQCFNSVFITCLHLE